MVCLRQPPPKWSEPEGKELGPLEPCIDGVQTSTLVPGACTDDIAVIIVSGAVSLPSEVVVWTKMAIVVPCGVQGAQGLVISTFSFSSSTGTLALIS